jgi:hypothetical protein
MLDLLSRSLSPPVWPRSPSGRPACERTVEGDTDAGGGGADPDGGDAPISEEGVRSIRERRRWAARPTSASFAFLSAAVRVPRDETKDRAAEKCWQIESRCGWRRLAEGARRRYRAVAMVEVCHVYYELVLSRDSHTSNQFEIYIIMSCISEREELVLPSNSILASLLASMFFLVREPQP